MWSNEGVKQYRVAKDLIGQTVGTKRIVARGYSTNLVLECAVGHQFIIGRQRIENCMSKARDIPCPDCEARP
jgi:hypothetical protein